jgi:hypothetical protein
MGTRLPDTGKATCVRNWGPFDGTDGFMFRLTGSGLSVVHRRTFDGVQAETVISQANWNGDRLDGAGGNSNRSGVTLDVTTANQYFYDYQVLGGGSIRWGIIINGERIICHEMDMSNRTDVGWQTNANLSVGQPRGCLLQPKMVLIIFMHWGLVFGLMLKLTLFKNWEDQDLSTKRS